jgi:hypothetical protein
LTQGGAAVAALVERDLRPILLGAEAYRIEALRQRPWRRLPHYGGRGGFASLAFRPSTPCCGSEA